MTNKAASELARMRWAKTTESERKEELTKIRAHRSVLKCPKYKYRHRYDKTTGVCPCGYRKSV